MTRTFDSGSDLTQLTDKLQFFYVYNETWHAAILRVFAKEKYIF
jgi:cytochrome c biogenesis protein ResB